MASLLGRSGLDLIPGEPEDGSSDFVLLNSPSMGSVASSERLRTRQPRRFRKRGGIIFTACKFYQDQFWFRFSVRFGDRTVLKTRVSGDSKTDREPSICPRFLASGLGFRSVENTFRDRGEWPITSIPSPPDALRLHTAAATSSRQVSRHDGSDAPTSFDVRALARTDRSLSGRALQLSHV